MNTRQVCFQVADAGLLHADLTRAIKNHEDFDLDQVVDSLIFTSRDLYAATKNDPETKRREMRLATGNLVTAFLSGLALEKCKK